MKLSLALGKPRVLDRETAWGCFTTNLAAPGCGSLFAGKSVGYAQLAFAAAGFALTVIGGLHTLAWFTHEYPQWQQSTDEPGERLQELWLNFRWPLLGMVLFIAGFLWALISSIGILMESSRNSGNRPLPPKL
jgi:hypothetical protein